MGKTCTLRCKQCLNYASEGYCDYMERHGHRRGCPPGNECTQFDPKNKIHRTRNPNSNGNNRRKPEDDAALLELLRQGKSRADIMATLDISEGVYRYNYRRLKDLI